MRKNKITAVILTGGKSSRIGRNKAFLEINGKPLIEILIEKLSRFFHRFAEFTPTLSGLTASRIIISTKNPKPYLYLLTSYAITRCPPFVSFPRKRESSNSQEGWIPAYAGMTSGGVSRIRIVRDRFRNYSSLVGIYSALKAVQTKYIFVIAVDMPRIEPKLLGRMLRLYKDYDVVIPETSSGMEPLCAIYSKNCTRHILRQIRKGNHKIIDFFDKIKVRRIKLKKAGIFNINRISDYKKIANILK
ncbi:MAG: molybdenum cofactor guanylyltransferase [Planctomycetota bacterium]|nr:molybdenum cofactor guanylyltransferase [Planctomycetota bacterium]MDI6788149.1 molybdenum cofactor guanylyltransferase [Planctomycetota bacterium]